jgi:hypothetical protein
MKKEKVLPAELEEGVMVAVIATLITFHITAWFLWQIPFPERLTNFTEHLKYWTALRINELAPPLFQLTSDDYRAFFRRPGIDSSQYLWRFNLALGIGVLAGGFLGFVVGKPKSSVMHIKGRQLWDGKEAVQRLLKKSVQECKIEGQGLRMHPTFSWRLSFNRETRHFLIIGGSGSGKTQIITPLMRAAIDRNDRMMVYDVKGDFTAMLPNHILIAPWDKRSYAWDVAKDCRNSQDASQLASKLIPEGHEPVWHNAARQILTAILIKLQNEKGIEWGWTDFFDEVCTDEKKLLGTVKKYLPVAIHMFNEPNKTTQSVLINFGAHMSLISDLSKAWGQKPLNMRFSFRDWLNSGKTPNRIVVFQGSGRYHELAKAYLQGVMSLVSGFINSPSFPDSRQRRVWLFLDEFPQIGELNQVASLLAVGRSKGVRVVLTAQDIHQIKAIYGDNVASTWMSSAGTIIITQIKSGETANYISNEVVGYQTRDRILIHEGKRQNPTRENVLVIEPSELETELGRKGNAVFAVVLGYGDAFLLNWPIKFPQKSDFLRQSSVEADWLKPPSKPGKKESRPAKINTFHKNDSGPAEEKLRLVLRAPSQSELMVMALTGTPVKLSAEHKELLSETAAGGNHE